MGHSSFDNKDLDQLVDQIVNQIVDQTELNQKHTPTTTLKDDDYSKGCVQCGCTRRGSSESMEGGMGDP